MSLEIPRGDPTAGKPDHHEGQNQGVATIRNWLVQRIADELSVESVQIPDDKPIYSLGVDSMQIVTLVAALEDELGIRFHHNPIEDHPTIAALAAYAIRLSTSDSGSVQES